MRALKKTLAWYMHLLILIFICTSLFYLIPEGWLQRVFENLQDDEFRGYSWSEIYGPGIFVTAWALSLISFFIPTKRLAAALVDIAMWHAYFFTWLMIGRVGLMCIPDLWVAYILSDTISDEFSVDEIPFFSYAAFTMILNGVIIFAVQYSIDRARHVLVTDN